MLQLYLFLVINLRGEVEIHPSCVICEATLYPSFVDNFEVAVGEFPLFCGSADSFYSWLSVWAKNLSLTKASKSFLIIYLKISRSPSHCVAR